LSIVTYNVSGVKGWLSMDWLPFMDNFRTLHLRFENTIMTKN